jgi:DNA-binding GntR family transcriptional regulator
VTICCAFATPAAVELAAEAAADELAGAAALLELELLVLELQAARTAAAVSAAPGATQRFHLCVIAIYSSIPPITSVRERLFSTRLLVSLGEPLGFAIRELRPPVRSGRRC